MWHHGCCLFTLGVFMLDRIFYVSVPLIVLGIMTTTYLNDATARQTTVQNYIDGPTIEKTVRLIVEKVGSESQELVQELVQELAHEGVSQAALFWREIDGTPEVFQDFCVNHFVATEPERTALLERFRKNWEAIGGHRVALSRTLRLETDLDDKPPMAVDLLFSSFDPFDHLSEDIYLSKIAFVALLNFPESKTPDPDKTRRQWAEKRLIQSLALRIPGEIQQATTAAYAAADDYIAKYNIHTSTLVDSKGELAFPDGPALITHWGLRDHIKSLYFDPEKNLDLQRMIAKVMDRILNQEIPSEVIDNPKVNWNPITNQVFAQDPQGQALKWKREPDTRYEKLLAVFKAEQAVDPYSPKFPSHISRKFDLEREIPLEQVRSLLIEILSDPLAMEVAKVIQKRLGRTLEPFDIWYDGFKVRSTVDTVALDAKVKSLYPNKAAFQDGLPSLLGRLGFSAETAKFLADHIVVDSSRGAGHAMGAAMRSDSARLRTRVGAGAMDYKGYNIALHELGHCVEQVFTLNRVDSTLMQGVPNTAFTEAFAFLFQDRDLEVLGIQGQDVQLQNALQFVDLYWMTFEIAGVSLLDMAVWEWMYENPDATPGQLREFTVAKAREIWNKYFAPALGVKDSAILAIYSHMVVYGLYLPDYAIGHLVHAQIENQIKGKNLASEMERMCVQGRLTPEMWMKGAVGKPLSTKPLIDAARSGLKLLTK